MRSNVTRLKRVRIHLPPGIRDADVALLRIYSLDLALLHEGEADESMELEKGHYIASAVAMDGGRIGLPTRFDVSEEATDVDVRLSGEASSETSRQQSSAFRTPFGSTIAVTGTTATSREAPAAGAATAAALEPATFADMTESASEEPDFKPALLRWNLAVDQPMPFAMDPIPGTFDRLAIDFQGRVPGNEETAALVFPGPGNTLRFAITPFDQPEGGPFESPRLQWTPARTRGFFLPNFVFRASSCNALQTALRHRNGSLARPLARRIRDLSIDAMGDKMRSPLAAVLGGLMLLRESPENLKKIDNWTGNLLNRFPWLPDALPLRVEVLATFGRHREAQALLADQLKWRGPPWSRRGLQALVERLAYYERTTGFSADADERIAPQYQRLLAMTHPACVFCVIEAADSPDLPPWTALKRPSGMDAPISSDLIPMLADSAAADAANEAIIPAGIPKTSKATTLSALRDEYSALYERCAPRPDKKGDIAYYMKKLDHNRLRYEAVGVQLGIPWYFIGIVHGLEGSFDFTTHLHNGDPLKARTVHIPTGRPETGEPPFSWEDSAQDALRLKGFDKETDWSISAMLYRFERYNGMGYRQFQLPSPYLWSFSNLYEKGKYASDGHFDAELVSKQCGAAVMLKMLQSEGESLGT